MNPDPSTLEEPNVVQSVLRHRFLVVGVVVAFGALGVLVAMLRPVQYVAEAGLLLRDPFSTVLIDSRSQRDETRYVADQIAVLKSSGVLVRASRLTGEEGIPEMSVRDLERASSIRTTADSNFIVVSVRADDPKKAQVGANSIVEAYRESVRSDLKAETEASIQRIDDATTAVAKAIAAVGEAEVGGAVALLRELSARRTRVQANAQLTSDGVALFSPAPLGKAQGTPVRSALVASMALGALVAVGLAYLVDLRRRRPMTVATPRAGFQVPALVEIPNFEREQLSSTLPALDAPGTGAAEAFRLLAMIVALRREPVEGSVGAKFSESLQDEFPGLTERELAVLDRVAVRLDELMLEVKKPSRSRKKTLPSITNRSVAFVAADSGDGTTTVAANTALAAAKVGDKVLMLDGDLATRGLTRLLLGERAASIAAVDGRRPIGFTDMLTHGLLQDGINRVVETSSGGALSIIEPGSLTIEALDAIRTDVIRVGLDSAQELFDRVFIDVPSPLRFPHSDVLLKSVDAVVVVVPGQEDESALGDLLARFELLGIRPIGYVRNFVPQRGAAQEMTSAVVDKVERVTSQIVKAGSRLAPVRRPSEEEPAVSEVSELEPLRRKPDLPSRKPDVPSRKPDIPSRKPDIPSHKPDIPSHKPDLPTQSERRRSGSA